MKYISGLTVAVLVCGLVLAGGLSATAQGTGAASQPGVQQPAAKQHHGGHKLARLAQELGLTANQKVQIKTILKSAKEQRQSIRDNSQLSDADKQSKLKELGKTTQSQ